VLDEPAEVLFEVLMVDPFDIESPWCQPSERGGAKSGGGGGI
jgi:hypothetical protein